MNKKLINPDRYYWLHYIPWRECIILLLISCLGAILHTLLSIQFISTILITLSTSLYNQLIDISRLLVNLGWKLAVFVVIAETLIVIVHHHQGIHVNKSVRLTRYLQNTLKHTLDIIPEDNIDRRVTASEVDSKRANKAIKKSMVVVYQESALIFIKLPTEIGTRHSITQYSDEAAGDIAEILDMRKSGRQVYQDHRTFDKYYYYELHH